MKVVLGMVVLVLVLGGGMWFFSSKEKAPAVVSPKETVQRENVKQPSAIGSIKDAMGLGEKMRCDYAIGQGKDAMMSSVYIDGQKFKTTTEVGGMKTEALFDGETQYVWSNNSTQGMKMSRTCLESLKDPASPNENTDEGNTNFAQDYQESFGMAQGVKCEKAGSIDFSVPASITFIDQCAMMEQNKKMMEQLKGMAPAGTYPGQ